MKALCWFGKHDVRVESVPDPVILNPHDCIVKITRTAICGSDLHLYDGYIPTMEQGDILGHEFMGEVVEVGREVKKRKVGDRVVVPFTIACGNCFYCKQQLWSLCDNSNPNAACGRGALRLFRSGLFGYSHMYGGYAGGQAQYARVPFADVGPLKIESDLNDEQVLFLCDIFPTGYMAAENCDIKDGRCGRGLGLRAGRSVRDPKCQTAGRRQGDRHRSCSGAAADGAGRRSGRRSITRRRRT